MTEKVLPYDRAIVPQETGYWCGPASTQIVLNTRGLIVPEATLAREIGTTVNGTDYVGLIERVLDLRVPDARYTSVYIENDPPTAAQREALWRNLKRSIDAGYGVVMNWVAPPSNYPRGVKGSVSPRYGGGTVYHYVAAMGYDDAGARAVWIADPGFQPQGYWISFDQCASLIPPKGYAYADVDAAPAAPIDPDAQAADALMRLMGGSVPFDRYRALLPAAQQCLADCECTTIERIAMWGAQVGHESVGLKYMTELWGPTPAQQGYEGRVDLGNTQPGDGYRFRGRGPIQVTGRRNYTVLSQWAHGKGLVPTPTYFVDNPDELASDRYGFVGVTWYWTTQRPMNDAADARDLVRATQYINGGQTGIDNRRDRYNSALAMGADLLKILNGGDDFMGALTAAEQREMLDLLRWLAAPDTGELRKRFPHRSMYATGPELDTFAGRAISAHAFGWDQRVEASAMRGEQWAIDNVRAAAAGTAWGVRQTPDGKPDPFLVGVAKQYLVELAKAGVIDGKPATPAPAPEAPTSPVKASCALSAAGCVVADATSGGDCALSTDGTGKCVVAAATEAGK
ncbi:lysin A, protease C39 domain [Mycobacterium phage ZoeJ]|uniref:Lysin A, protease C39 domain n=1 Tax=Mycobacterium phage ZoeJ TaxID=1486427 RepID=A0A023W6V3_9CAUD|nr:endolysin [Mycobacterium phage ZoeJ]AHY26852.1 lysin A, protease C39 domain [Mycobacterium phage ZoeJ]